MRYLTGGGADSGDTRKTRRAIPLWLLCIMVTRHSGARRTGTGGPEGRQS
jgi:hypothetical protein